MTDELKPIDFTIENKTIQITPFQLLQWRAGLRLEKVGLKLSRNKTISSHMRKSFNLKRTYTISDLESRIVERLRELKNENEIRE